MKVFYLYLIKSVLLPQNIRKVSIIVKNCNCDHIIIKTIINYNKFINQFKIIVSYCLPVIETFTHTTLLQHL